MGMWPGYFSGNAASFPYFRNATWYNRDRPLFQRYIPVLREINRAGWEPVTFATVAATNTNPTSAATNTNPTSANPTNTPAAAADTRAAAPSATPSTPSSGTSYGVAPFAPAAATTPLASPSRVWVERFGPAADNGLFVYFTVRNEGRSDLAVSLTLNVNGSAVGITEGRHTVWDMTRQRQMEATMRSTDGVLAIVADASTVGGVALNQTVVFKVELQALEK
jgi:hypothetical protein